MGGREGDEEDKGWGQNENGRRRIKLGGKDRGRGTEGDGGERKEKG